MFDMCYSSVGSDMCHAGLTELTVSLTLQWQEQTSYWPMNMIVHDEAHLAISLTKAGPSIMEKPMDARFSRMIESTFT